MKPEIQFISSFFSFSQIPKNFTYPQIAFFGRSNVGKSSLINAIFMKKIAKTSSQPGKTQSINFFELNQKIYIVDLPGFGYSKMSHTQHKQAMNLIQTFLNQSKYLNCILLLCDSRREIPTEEINLLETCYRKKIMPILIRTKFDKLSQKEKNSLKAESKNFKKNFPTLDMFFTSIKHKTETKELRNFFLNFKNLTRKNLSL